MQASWRFLFVLLLWAGGMWPGQSQELVPITSGDSVAASADSLAAKDSLLILEEPEYIERDYNHKQQVIVGSVVMFCIALVLVAMNNYNPRR